MLQKAKGKKLSNSIVLLCVVVDSGMAEKNSAEEVSKYFSKVIVLSVFRLTLSAEEKWYRVAV